MKKIVYVIIILTVGLLSACKKDKNKPVSPKTGASLGLVEDSVYLYEKEDYLWSDAIPDYATFKPRSYTASTDLGALTNEINAISQLKINPATHKPYEYYPQDPGFAKYSFVDDGTEASSLNGTNGDFGFEPLYMTTTDLRVKYVYPGSPADQAGLKRGYQIKSINNNTDLDYDGGYNVNFVVNAVYYSKSIKMVLLKPDGSSVTVNLTARQYTVNPVLTYKVFDEGSGHKVGYIVFNSFTALTNAQPKLDAAFNYFIANGVNDLVVDLRYNGGGASETAEYIDNLIAPAAKSGSLMYTSYFSTNLQNDQCPLLTKALEKEGFSVPPGIFKPENNRTKFSKKLTLNLSRVFFIVTSATASSSELTINNLRPALTVQLIGDTTYGKPVGEITIPIDKYVLFSPQEYVENSANQGDYYAGMAPGSITYPGKLDRDDVTKDFGDPTEALLADALNYVKYNTYAIAGLQVQNLSRQYNTLSLYKAKTMARKLDVHKFKPMILPKNKLNSD